MLYVRADAGPTVGIGHFVRCIALAQEWMAQGGRVVFLSEDLPVTLAGVLARERIELVELRTGGGEETRSYASLLARAGCDWLVLDGYDFGLDHQREAKGTGVGLLLVDDGGRSGQVCCADALLNQNLGAEALDYTRSHCSALFLGAKYILLRREFIATRKQDAREVARNIVITLGGGDPENHTLSVLRAVAQVLVDQEDARVRVVVGATNPHIRELQSFVASHHIAHAVSLISHTDDMPEMMAWADVAISAGGSTCWELAYVGVPNLIVVMAENQEPIASHLDRAGVSISLGPAENLVERDLRERLLSLMSDRDLRDSMRRTGQSLVDGQGARRIVEAMRTFAA